MKKLFTIKKMSCGSTENSMYRSDSGLLRYSHIIKELKKIKNSNRRFLDIGCGQGLYSVYASFLFKISIGIDISLENTYYLKKRIKDLRLMNCISLIADGSKLPFRENSFSLILFSEVLEHIPPSKVYKVLEEIKRVIAQNGKIIITVPSIFLDYKKTSENKFKTIKNSFILSNSSKIKIIRNRVKEINHFHNFFTKKELKMLMSEINFYIVKMHYIVKNTIVIPVIFFNFFDIIKKTFKKIGIRRVEKIKKGNQITLPKKKINKFNDFPNIKILPYKLRLYENFPNFGNHILIIIKK